MPIYVLNAGNQRAHIPVAPLSVSITGSVQDAALDLHAGPTQPVMRSSARHAVLPELVGPVTIAVRPAGWASGSVRRPAAAAICALRCSRGLVMTAPTTAGRPG